MKNISNESKAIALSTAQIGSIRAAYQSKKPLQTNPQLQNNGQSITASSATMPMDTLNVSTPQNIQTPITPVVTPSSVIEPTNAQVLQSQLNPVINPAQTPTQEQLTNTVATPTSQAIPTMVKEDNAAKAKEPIIPDNISAITDIKASNDMNEMQVEREKLYGTLISEIDAAVFKYNQELIKLEEKNKNVPKEKVEPSASSLVDETTNIFNQVPNGSSDYPIIK
jgi:hypothetical protein